MTEQESRTVPATEDEAQEDDHLSDVPTGAGCTEIWEHLSERRTADD